MSKVKSIVVQIQGISRPIVAQSAHTFMSCVADLVPDEDWNVDADDVEDCCNVYIKSRQPVALWQKVYALASLDPRSLRTIESCWIVVCEGRRAWDDYKTFANFNERKKKRR